jgi:caffeoyl-CoA O-methyltransferase
MINELEKYCIMHSNPETDLLEELKSFTYNNEPAPQMISDSIVCNALVSIIKMINAQKILEIGMFTGYSALFMAQALPDFGELHTCEVMNRHVKNASKFFNQSKHKNKIYIHPGEALKSLENFKVNSFDLIFIDADKKNYIEYYNYSMQLLRNGGVIVLDNMLWGGSVLNPKDLESKTLSKLGRIINNDSRIFNVLLPIRDGLMICIKQ